MWVLVSYTPSHNGATSHAFPAVIGKLRLYLFKPKWTLPPGSCFLSGIWSQRWENGLPLCLNSLGVCIRCRVKNNWFVFFSKDCNERRNKVIFSQLKSQRVARHLHDPLLHGSYTLHSPPHIDSWYSEMILHLLGTKWQEQAMPLHCPPCNSFPQPSISRGTAVDSYGSSILYTLVSSYGNREKSARRSNAIALHWDGPSGGALYHSSFLSLVRLFLVGYSCSFEGQQPTCQSTKHPGWSGLEME